MQNKYLKYRTNHLRTYEKDARDILLFVKEELNLDPKETDFLPATSEEIDVLAAYLFPVALPHWSRGKNLFLQKNSKGKIYEIVFNTSPALAYINETTKPGETKFIIAHVFGHSHIYKHNIYESEDSEIYSKVKFALDRYFAYYEEHGERVLEELIDFVHSLRFIFSMKKLFPKGEETLPKTEQTTVKIKESNFKFVNKNKDEKQNKLEEKEDDLFSFIIKHSYVLEDWQKDILYVENDFINHIYKKARIKYVHEGFATWTHRKAFLRFFDKEDFFDSVFLDLNIYPSEYNPYWFGSAILEALEDFGYDIVNLVNTISDGELFYAYFTKEVWEKIVSKFRGLLSKDEIDALIKKYEEIRNKMLSMQYEKIARVYVDNYSVSHLNPEVWDVVKGESPIKSNKSFPLTLTSDVPLDEVYARETAKAIAKIWKNDVFVRYKKK